MSRYNPLHLVNNRSYTPPGQKEWHINNSYIYIYPKIPQYRAIVACNFIDTVRRPQHQVSSCEEVFLS